MGPFLLVLDAFEEPGLGVAPLSLDRAFRQIQDLRNLRFSETGEETEFHDFRLLSGEPLKLFERFIELQNNFVFGRGGDFNLIQRDLLGILAVPHTEPPPGAVYEDMSHGFGSGAEEMPAVLPSLMLIADQPQISLMHQSGGLQSLSGRQEGHFVGSESAQFLIDQREQFVSGFAVAVLDPLEDLGDVAHARKLNCEQRLIEAQTDECPTGGAGTNRWHGGAGELFRSLPIFELIEIRDAVLLQSNFLAGCQEFCKPLEWTQILA